METKIIYESVDVKKELPPIDEVIGWGISHRVFIQGINGTGEEMNCIGCYDYRDKKWRFISSGIITPVYWFRKIESCNQ